uniref:Peroxin-3 n=1 Tax=Blastobotrys adeninivorans TaxID=409370 RepID=A0A060T8S8_BLAAD
MIGLPDFVRRHRRKILVATGIAATGYLLVDYIKSKFFELQDRLATERAARENLKRRFEQNQQDATFTIMALLPSLGSQMSSQFPVEKTTAELQAKRTERASSKQMIESTETMSDSLPSVSSVASSVVRDDGEDNKPRKSKTELWSELKTQSLSRAFTLVYSSALLVFFTRLQLNILGRKNYVMSVVQMADKKPSGHQITMENLADSDMASLALEEEELHTNRMYLTFSWWLLNKGWVALSERIRDAVVQVFDPINPRKELTLAEFSELIGRVQFAIDHPSEQTTQSNFLHNLLPPQELESYVLAQAPSDGDGTRPNNFVDATLRRLLDETADFIESPNAVDVIHKLVHSGLSVFVGRVATLYPAEDFSGTPTENPSKVKLASILANVSKQAQGMTSGSPFEPNEYITAMIDVPDLDGFSALVYSNFDWANLGIHSQV